MKLIHTSDWHFGMGVGTGSLRVSMDSLTELKKYIKE